MKAPRGWVQLGGLGGVLSLPLIVLAAISSEAGSGDFREGPFAWLVAATGAAIALFASGLWRFVEPSRSRVLRPSAALLLVGSLGLLALFGGIAVGSALGVDEPTGLIGMGPIAAGVAALTGFSLGLVLLGFGMLRNRLFPWWARLVPLVLALESPLAMVASGAAEGTAESAVFVAWLSSFGLGWAVLGYAMWGSGRRGARSPAAGS